MSTNQVRKSRSKESKKRAAAEPATQAVANKRRVSECEKITSKNIALECCGNEKLLGAKEKMARFIERTITEGEHLINCVFPHRVGELDKLLETELFADKCDTSFSAASGDTTRDDHLEVNRLLSLVRPLLQRAMNETTAVLSWLALQTPRIEDGNNFGVEVQEEMRLTVEITEAGFKAKLSDIAEYRENRARLVAKANKHPNSPDYALAVQELDASMSVRLRRAITKLRNEYAAIANQVTKNIERVRRPRGTEHLASMY